ncbi:MAG: glutamine synthetase beta-grasp domain-containing protein, partial [Candidatus Korarchaeum sp.]
MQPEDILKWVNEGSVDKVELEYVDILGYLRGSLISAQRFLESKVGSFDASSVKIAEISRSDASLVPDFSTSILIGDTCRILCEIWEDMGRRRSRMDPRFVAERTEEVLLSEGYRGYVGAEIEFFVLGKDLRPVSLPWSEGRVNYMVSPPLDPLRELEVEVLRELSEAKLNPEVTHH